MTWEDTDKAMAASRFFKLADDGATAEIVFVGEPEPVKKEGKGGVTARRYYMPVYFNGEVMTWDCSRDTISRIAALPGRGYARRFVVTRHGKKDDPRTYYTFVEKPLSVQETNWLKRSGFLVEILSDAGPARTTGDDAIPF
jgi:hypothetical protein